MELPVKALHSNAILPHKAHKWDAGLDLHAIEPRYLFYKHVVGIKTGISVAIPQGYFGLVAIRSSLGKLNIQLANAPGIIDAGYRGEIIVMLTVLNENFDRYHVKEGDRIAQMLVLPTPTVTPFLADDLPSSDGRGTGGFGSSGRAS